jgi:hypothetical protein
MAYMGIKLTILALISITLSGCLDYKPMVGPPWMQEMLTNGPPGGNASFRLGWRHGCETGISVSANKFQRSFYKFRQDYRMVKDPTYYKAWKTSYDYCHRYVAQYLRRNLI